MNAAMNATWCGLAFLVLLSAGCAPQRSVDPQFKTGREALMRGEYQKSITTLRGYLKDNPQGRLASRASFLTAKAYMGLGDLKQARQHFEKTLEAYPASEEAHKSRYKLAVVSLLQGDRADALQRFKQLAERPDGTLAPESAAMVRYLTPGEKE